MSGKDPAVPGTPARAGRFAREGDLGSIEQCFQAIAAAEDSIVDEATARVRAEFPPYAQIPHERLRQVVAGSFRRGAAAMRERRGPTRDELDEAAAIAESQARFGVPLDVMLQACRVGIASGAERCMEIARRYEVDPSTQLEYMQLLWQWWDIHMVVTANAHRSVDLERARHDQDQRAAFVRSLLFGSLSAGELQSRGAAYGLATGAKYIPFRARPGGDADTAQLAEAIESAGAEDGRPPLIAVLDGDLAGVLSRPPEIALDGTIALGPSSDLDSLEPAFRQASRALDTAIAFDLTGLVSLDDLSLRPAVLSEGLLGDRMVARYLEPLADQGDFGKTLEATLVEYLRLGMRVDDTARALDVHPNTLRHRLERFEQITGADLRCTQNLVEVWWALQRRRVAPARD